jgi:hypothetical protein
MKRTVKILSGILAVSAIALSVCILLIVIGWPVSETRMLELLVSIRRLPTALLTVLCALLLCALGVFTLYGLFSAHYQKRTSATIERSETGETAISFTALAELANQVARSHPEVKNSKARVTAIGDKVKIAVSVTTSPVVSLIELTHALQSEIAARILAVCGVSVGDVDVTVDQTEEAKKPSRIK